MIYHYTSIDNLALILKTKKIRFTRMDLVDDLMENEGLPPALEKIAFVSCWTEDPVENIALWNMYTPKMKGIKISVPKHPWRTYIIPKGEYPGLGTFYQDLHLPLPLNEIIADNYRLFPSFDIEEVDGKANWFYKKVVYNDDYRRIYQDLLRYNADTKSHEIYDVWDIGRYKTTQWAFQKECRYTIYAQTLLPIDHPTLNFDKNEQWKSVLLPFNEPSNPLLKDFYNLEFIDVPLNEDYLHNITITLGPMCTLSDQIIVEALLKEYAQGGTLDKSPLTGKIRIK